MRYLLIVIFSAFLCVSVFPGPAGADMPQSPPSSQRPPSVMQAERYLNSLGTAKARFVQTAYDGSQVIGTFYLDRPGKLRFEYDDPIEDFIVADGFLIYFYDSELEEQTNAPIGTTMADFLLRSELSLQGDIKVTDVSRNDHLLQITLVQAGEPEAGSLTLGFMNEPFQLKKWRVTDPNGAITEVELFQLQTGIPLDKNLFFYSDPKRFRNQPHYNE